MHMRSTAQKSGDISKNYNDAPIKIMDHPKNIIDRLTTGVNDKNEFSNTKRIAYSSVKKSKKRNNNSISTEIDYNIGSYDDEMYETNDDSGISDGPPAEFTINTIMTTTFANVEVFDKKFIKANWKDLSFIFKQNWIIISGVSHFQKILSIWKQTLFTDILCDKPELLRDLLVIYFKTAEECYSDMILDYKTFLYDFFDVIKYLINKIEGFENALIYAFSSLFKKNCNF